MPPKIVAQKYKKDKKCFIYHLFFGIATFVASVDKTGIRTNISKNIKSLNVKMTLSIDIRVDRPYLFLSYDKCDKSLKGLAGADHEIRKSKNQTNKYLLKKLLSSYQRSEL